MREVEDCLRAERDVDENGDEGFEPEDDKPTGKAEREGLEIQQ